MRRKGPCDCLTEEREFDCNVPFSRRRLPIFGVSPGGGESLYFSLFLHIFPSSHKQHAEQSCIDTIYLLYTITRCSPFSLSLSSQLPCSSSILMTKTRGLVFMPIAVCCLGLPFSRQTGGQWRPIICFLIAVLTARASDGVK